MIASLPFEVDSRISNGKRAWHSRSSLQPFPLVADLASNPAQLPVIAENTATDLERKRFGFCADQFRGVILMTRRWWIVEVDHGVRGARTS